jgi:hypothetical protein
VSLLRNVEKAAYVPYAVPADDKRWTITIANKNLAEVIRYLTELVAALGPLDPPLQFVRIHRGRRVQEDARQVIQAHLATFRERVGDFHAYRTGRAFHDLKDYIRYRLMPDIRKLQRRHTRVFITRSATARRISSPSEQEGGARGWGRGKKLTARLRRMSRRYRS